jgi:hypothetical protein
MDIGVDTSLTCLSYSPLRQPVSRMHALAIRRLRILRKMPGSFLTCSAYEI